VNELSAVGQMHRFRTFAFEKCHDLETWVMGHARSLEMAPFDRSHMTSYSHSIVTLVLVRTVSEIA